MSNSSLVGCWLHHQSKDYFIKHKQYLLWFTLQTDLQVDCFRETMNVYKNWALIHRNPALEDQACDRIYRVGQSLDVTIHK